MRNSRNVKKETCLKETYLKVTSRDSELEKCERTRVKMAAKMADEFLERVDVAREF